MLWLIASIWRLMINTSYIISFHIAKFLVSNFLISLPVSEVEAWTFSFTFLPLLILMLPILLEGYMSAWSFSLTFLPLLIPALPGSKITLIPLVDRYIVWSTDVWRLCVDYGQLCGSKCGPCWGTTSIEYSRGLYFGCIMTFKKNFVFDLKKIWNTNLPIMV